VKGDKAIKRYVCKCSGCDSPIYGKITRGKTTLVLPERKTINLDWSFRGTKNGYDRGKRMGLGSRIHQNGEEWSFLATQDPYSLRALSGIPEGGFGEALTIILPFLSYGGGVCVVISW